MVIKYERDFLLSLQNSPLCTRPDNLPPLEEWMGSAEQQQQQQPRQANQSMRNRQFQMGQFDKNHRADGTPIDQTNRRSESNRHVSRNSANNPEDIVFGPPRTAFTSSGRNKVLDNDRIIRDSDGTGRFANLRNRMGDPDGDRFRDGRNANSTRRRDAGDQDTEGWSTVKPGKSFGADGAEKFLQGRMGGNFRDEKRAPREREERSVRTFESSVRDSKEGEEEGRPRNGLARHKAENSESRLPEKRERMDRAKSWRERDPEAEAAEDHAPSRADHRHDRRWGGGRDQRGEREPEWFDEPAAPQAEARTQEDFKKWLADMKKAKGEASATATGPPSATLPEPVQEKAKSPPVRPTPAVVPGPDKFFAAFGSPTDKDDGESKPSASKSSGKSSRFTSFFNQEASKTEPATPAAAAPPPQPSGMNGLLGALAGMSSTPGQNTNEEKQAFQMLLSKLQKQTMSSSPGGVSPFAAPSQPQFQQQGPHGEHGPKPPVHSPFQDSGLLGRPPIQHHLTDIHAPRPQQSARPDQLLQDLTSQQQHQRVSSQGSSRADLPPQRSNGNTEFLMNLMRAGSDGQRADSAILRASQQTNKPSGPSPMGHPHEREPEFGPDSRGPQASRMRQGPPPGFGMDEGFRGGEPEYRGPPPPTQILQRPQPPPGLDRLEQGPPPGFLSGPGGPLPPHLQQHQGSQQQPPPQQPQNQQQPRHMISPPGLPAMGGPGGPAMPGRNGPLPPGMAGMFPPNMRPMPPHPEHMGNMPPRGMGPPPPGFFNGPPPHGFMPPGMGGFDGPPGPDFAGGLYERGMPPPNAGRGGNFRG